MFKQNANSLLNQSRTLMTLGILCSSDIGTNSKIGILEAIELTTRISSEYSGAWQAVKETIREGEAIAKAVRNSGVFLPFVAGLLDTAEETGDLPHIAYVTGVLVERVAQSRGPKRPSIDIDDAYRAVDWYRFALAIDAGLDHPHSMKSIIEHCYPGSTDSLNKIHESTGTQGNSLSIALKQFGKKVMPSFIDDIQFDAFIKTISESEQTGTIDLAVKQIARDLMYSVFGSHIDFFSKNAPNDQAAA